MKKIKCQQYYIYTSLISFILHVIFTMELPFLVSTVAWHVEYFSILQEQEFFNNLTFSSKS